MQKKTSWHGLHSGLPPYVSEAADLAQWDRGPKVLGPSIAARLVQQSEATKAEQLSEPKPGV